MFDVTRVGGDHLNREPRLTQIRDNAQGGLQLSPYDCNFTGCAHSDCGFTDQEAASLREDTGNSEQPRMKRKRSSEEEGTSGLTRNNDTEQLSGYEETVAEREDENTAEDEVISLGLLILPSGLGLWSPQPSLTWISYFEMCC